MTLSYRASTQARRSFFLLFGGIWLTAGLVFAIIGGGALLLPTSSPSDSRPADVEAPAKTSADEPPPILFVAIGLLVGGIGGFLVVRELRRIRYQARLEEVGIATRGTVTAVEETNVRLNRVRQWRVHYRYCDHAGREHQGKTGHLAPNVATAWHTDGTGDVRFDRDAPERSIWIG